jgi:surface polysaccharide O-acyltransferase-like enzyme
MLRGGVPVFFMLTGALFLSRDELNIKRFLNTHVLRLILLFVFWSVLYAIGSRLVSGGLVFDYQFFYDVAKGHYHLWFLTAMATCCLFLPVVHAAIHKGELKGKYLLFLFFGLSILCANCNLTPDTALILNRITLNFSLDYLPYLGYAVWGWWLSRQSLGKCWLWIAPVGFLACTIATTCGNIWYSHYKGVADGWLFSYFSLSTLTQATMIFCFFQALREHEFKRPKLWAGLADCTLGVYLIHPLMINLVEALGFSPSLSHPVSSLVLFTLLVGLICFIVVLIMRHIPIVRKLI